MKYKLIAVVLVLTTGAWAQNSIQSNPAPQTGAPAVEKTSCPCCDKKASTETTETKSAAACCAHHDTAANDGKMMSCAGKDKTKTACCSTTNGDACKRVSGKTAAACCGKKCGADCKNGCCAADNKSNTTAMNCCKGEHCMDSAMGTK